MDLILLRHAEKSMLSMDEPLLTPRGHEQARSLITEMQQKHWPRPQKIMASPKIRTQQTLAPLAKELNLETEIWDGLDERHHDESPDSFRRRIKMILENLENNLRPDCILWCTHMDWIEEFCGMLDCEQDLLSAPYTLWSPTQYLIFQSGDLWSVTASGRSPR